MKKFLGATILAAMLTLSTTAHAAQSYINLPATMLDDGSAVMIALDERKTIRDFVDRDLTNAQLGKILWAANGLNRPDGKRVNPVANGVYSVDVYVVTRAGVYIYIPEFHQLKLIAEGDHRMTTTTGQSFVGKAAVNLVYVENPDAWSTARHTPPPRDRQIACANVTVGAMVQSVALAAQTESMGNCVRGSINRDAFAKVAGISAENILLAQSVGFTK